MLGLIHRLMCIARSSNSICGSTYRLFVRALLLDIMKNKSIRSEPEILRLAGTHYPRSRLLIKT